MSSKIFVFSFLFSLVCILCFALGASAIELRLYGPDKILSDKLSQASLSLYSEKPFFGIMKVNVTNCNTSESVFGFSNVEFIMNGSLFVYKRPLSIVSQNPGSFKVIVTVWNLSQERLAHATLEGLVSPLDTAPPVVTLISPKGPVDKQFVNITFRTDEFAVCKLDLANVSYASMSRRLSDQDALHYIVLELSAGIYRYFVSCKDRFDNTMTPVAIDFSVVAEPSAAISLNPSSPVKSGLLEITLISSMPLAGPPKLSYDFDSGPVKTIALEGSRDTWKGYLVIDQDNTQKIGAFHYTGVSFGGQSSSKITSGELFIVDTVPPPKVSSLLAKDGAAISLSWFYDEKSIDHFNIYRSISPDVGPVNLYSKSSIKSYDDIDTVGGTTYYYKVAAVDEAMNDGPLSDMVSALSARPIVEKKVEPELEKRILLDKSMVYRVNSTIAQLGDLSLDIGWSKKTFSEITSGPLLSAGSDLKLMESVKDSSQKLDQYRSELKDLWYQDLTERELDKRINQVLDKVAALRHATPESVKIIENANVVQSFGRNPFQDSFSAAFADYRLDRQSLDRYAKDFTLLQDYLHVSSVITTLQVSYLDGTTQDYTLWDKKISVDDSSSIKPSMIVELIPKSVADDVLEVTFLTPDFEVLKSDPIVSWKLVGLSARIKYYVKKSVLLERAKDSYTSVFAPIVLQEEKNDTIAKVPITANVVKEEPALFTLTEKVMMFIGIIIIIGLVVYYLAGTSFDDMMAEHNIRSYVRRSRKTKSSYIMDNYSDYLKMQEDHEALYAHMLLRKANSYLENKEPERALSIYQELQSIYSKLSKDRQLELYDGCLKLYERLGDKWKN